MAVKRADFAVRGVLSPQKLLIDLGPPPTSCEELTEIALKLPERVDLGLYGCYRLVGIGLTNFGEAEKTGAQPTLSE